MRIPSALLLVMPLCAATTELANIPIHFEPNVGQERAEVRFAGAGVEVLDDGFRVVGTDVRMRLVGARKPAGVRMEEKLAGVSHFLKDPDPAQWKRGVANYAKVGLRAVYSGVDVLYYGRGGRVEYDFVVAAGSDAGQIGFVWEGGDVWVDEKSGDLVLKGKDGEFRQEKPVAYQMVNGKRRNVEVAYALDGERVGFRLGRYDQGRELVIDPTLVYAYPLGIFSPRAVAVDAQGAAYVLAGESLYKINAQGTGLVWTAQLSFSLQALAVSGNGSAYVCGSAGAAESLKNAVQPAYGGGDRDALVGQLTTGGDDYVFKTYFGGAGNDVCGYLRLDGAGRVYLLGTTDSDNFPLKDAAQGARAGLHDLFVTKLAAGGQSVVFSTYYGGGATDGMSSLWVDAAGNTLVTTWTESLNFPMVNATFTVPTREALVKFNATGQVVFSTYMAAYGGYVVTDPQGNIYTAGTNSGNVLALPPGAGIAKMNANGTGFQRLVGLTNDTTVRDLTADGQGNLYVIGTTWTLEMVRPMEVGSGEQGFLMKVTAAGAVVYATPFEQAWRVAADAAGAAYLVGTTDQPGLFTLGRVYAAKVTDTPDTTRVRVTLSAATTQVNPGVELVVDGVRLVAPVTLKWNAGSTHTISTAATQGSGSLRYRFQGWSDGGALTHTVTVPANTATAAYTANFLAEILLTTAVFPAGSGTVQVTPSSSDGYYPVGTNVTLTAVPGSGFSFLGWSGTASGSTNPRQYTLLYSITLSAHNVIANFTSTPPPPTMTSLGFVPVAPCRLMDTRFGEGRNEEFGPPFLAGGTTRTIPVPQGVCNLPLARAYSVNVTVVPLKPLSYLTLYPAGAQRPLVSTLNAFEGQIVANAAIVPAGLNGGISVFVTDDTHVIIDVNGYFTESTGAEALSFYRLTPCRVVDTRTAVWTPPGMFGPPSITANTSRSFQLSTTQCGIPGNARAYVANVTVVPPGPLDYVTVFPTGATRPLVSTLNSPLGRVVANAAIIPADANGAISIYAPQTTDVVVDVSGYFAPAGQANALRFYTVAPCRLADTRGADGPIIGAQTERSFVVGTVNGSRCNVPATAAAYSLNATVVPPSSLGYLTLYSGAGPRPLVSTLNAWEGQVVANSAIVPGAGGGVVAYVTNATHLVLDINGYFAP